MKYLHRQNLNVSNVLDDTVLQRADKNIELNPHQKVLVKGDVVTTGNQLPGATDTHNLGSDDYRWNEAHVNDIFLDGITLNTAGGSVSFVTDELSKIYVQLGGDDVAGDGTNLATAYRTIKYALSQAVAGQTIVISPGIYEEEFPLTVPQGVHVIGAGLRATSIKPTLATNNSDAFLLNGETTIEDLTIRDVFYDSVDNTGYAFRFAPGTVVTTRSPYVQRVTVLNKGSVVTASDPYGFAAGDAGRGAFLDGAQVTRESLEAAILFNECTFIVPNSRALIMTNGARTEWLNCFTYFADLALEGKVTPGGAGRGGDGKTYLNLKEVSGSWAVGDTITYYDFDGVTVLATATIEDIIGDRYVLDGNVQGFEQVEDRAPKLVTAAADAKISVVDKKFGTGSLYLDGTGDRLDIATSNDFGFGLGDFTIEMFVNRSVIGTNFLYDFRTSANQAVPTLYCSGSTLNYYVNGSIVITAASALPSTGVWYHIAVSRTGNITKMFVNGTQVGSNWIDNTNYIAAPVRIGASTTASGLFNGYIDEIRITKGISRYNSNFATPTQAFNGDSQTVLLMHFDAENSRLSKTVTPAGTVASSNLQSKFGGGSILFNGTTDYATVASSTDFQFGTGDFTFEFWAYRVGTGVIQTLFDIRPAAGAYQQLNLGSTNPIRYAVTGSTVITGPTLAANTWTHIAVARESGVTRLFVNGTQVVTTYSDANNYGQAAITIGAANGGTSPFNGYLDEIRITKGLARYTEDFAVAGSAFANDGSTVLLVHGDTDITDDGQGVELIEDDSVVVQDIRSSAGGTATGILRYDRAEFAAEMRAIAGANVYGNQGAKADGPDVRFHLMAHNFAYIGTGADLTNDASNVDQESEVIEINGGRIYYNSVDQSGNFRVGDLFTVNFETGIVSFANAPIDVTSITGITFSDGTNTTTVAPSGITTGNLVIAGNTVSSTSGGITIDPVGSQPVILNSPTTVSDNLTVSGDVEIQGGDLTTSSFTFNLLNTNATTINAFGSATTIEIGASGGTTSINHNLTVDGDVTLGDSLDDTVTINGDVILSLPDNTVAALEFKEGTNSYIKLNTTDASELTEFGTLPKVNFANTTDATDATTAATTFAGGVGIAKKLYVGTDFDVNGNSTLGDNTADSLTATGSALFVLPDNTAAAFQIKEGTSNYFTLDTTDATERVKFGTTPIVLVENITDSTTFDSGALIVSGGVGVAKSVVIKEDLAINGGDLTTTATTFNLLNTTATTVNAFGAATSLTLSANTGTTVIRNNLDVDLDVNIDGSDLTTNQTTFNLLNTTAETVNAFGAATIIEIGAATGTTSINHNLTVNGDVTLGNSTADTVTINGDVILSLPDNTVAALDFKEGTNSYIKINTTDTSELTEFGALPKVKFANTTDATNSTTAATIFAGGVGIAKKLYVGDNLTVSGDVAALGGDLTTTSTTFNLLNSAALTVNAFGAATIIEIGAATGTTNINHDLDVDGDINIDGGDLTVGTTSFNLANTTATTINAFGSATAIEIGAATGTTSINHNLTVDGDVTLGDTTSDTTTINGDVSVNLPDNTALALQFKQGTDSYIKLDTTDASELTEFGTLPKVNFANTTDATNSTTAATTFAGGVGVAKKLYVGTDADIGGDLEVKGGDLTTNQTTFNLINTTATTVNFAGVATDIQIGSSSGTTNINNSLDVDGDVNIDGGDLTASTTAFNLLNSTVQTINFGGATTAISLGGANTLTTATGALTVEKSVKFTQNSASTNTTSGTLVVTGGVGISGALNVGEDANFNGNGSEISMAPSGTGTVIINPSATGSISNMNIGLPTRGSGAFTTLTANDFVTLTANAASTSTTTGTLVVTGGVGVSGTIYANTVNTNNLTHSGLTLSSGTNVDQLKTVNTSLTITTSWQDTGIKNTDLATGSYYVQLYANDSAVGGGHVDVYYSGVLSWYAGTTSETTFDEIVLNRAGAAVGSGALYLRLQRSSGSPDNLRLQISGTTINSSAATYTFKFRRII